MDTVIGVYGASGFGKEVMPILREQYSDLEKESFFFIDDGSKETELNSYPVLKYEDFLKISAITKKVSLAIANSVIRQKLADKLAEDNIQRISVRAKTVIIQDCVEIQEGSTLCANVCLHSNVKIGKHFHANIYSYVAHDCIIGDYVTFAPNVSCNGNIHIHDHAYIGTGAILKQGTPDKPLIIGKGAVVGMGAVVTKDVEAGTTVIGNPAKPMEKR